MVWTFPRCGLLVHVDHGRLVQIIVNLLTNASKFSPGRGRIEVCGSAKGGVALEVRDYGSGIAADLLPRGVELFVQGKQSAERSGGGLGLAIAKNLALLHGGALRAESEERGRGSAFSLEIPLAKKNEGTMGEGHESQRRSGERARRILVVDDNEDAASLLGVMLESWGHEVRIAHDGPAAVEAADAWWPEIALLDIGLPVMDGYELASHLTARLSPHLPKLVAVSGYGEESDRARSRDAGFCRHLVKPVDALRLRDVLVELA